jgi:uncharacterized membrane protein
MPDPIPTNRNVRQGQQSRNTPVPRPVRPRPAPPLYTPPPAPPRYRPVPARPVSTRPPATAVLRRNPWDHRVAALVVGASLYGAGNYYINTLFSSYASFLNHLWISIQLGSSIYALTTQSLLIAVLFAVPLFFGAAFGPWIGLLVGAIGSLVSDYFAAGASSLAFNWHWGAAMGLIGFCASLAPYRTRRRYTCLTTILIATIVGALAIAIGIGGAFFSLNWSLNPAYTINVFASFVPSALVAIIIFSFLIFMYNTIVSHR